MKVHIEDNLYLEADGIEYTIKKYGNEYINGKGEQITPSTTLGHFTNVQSAMRYLVKMKLMESTAMNLKELISSVTGIEDWIKEKIGV